MPSNNVLDNYGVKLMSMMNIIEANKGENIRLATLRDTLLPKLMSGELKVNEIVI
jgi:type I restriction enzyme S subunit